MIPRECETALKEFSKGYPVITITGPRQSGKTTLAKVFFSDKPYVSFENPDTREQAASDPRSFLTRFPEGAVFDEVQRLPEIISYLQQIVDDSNQNAMFILTGSQQFGLLSNITQSLAGRSALIHLLPFTISELYKKKELPSLDNVLWTGLYPPIHDRNLNPAGWYANYVQMYLERDIRQLINVHNLHSFQRFIRLCAGRTGQLLNLSDLASDAGITHNTAKSWISILETSYVIFLLQPHHTNFNKRLIKTSKLFFYDTGLAAWLLGIRSPKDLNIHPMRGPLFESFITSELIKKYYNTGMPHNLFFWRDRKGLEIDVLAEEHSSLIPIEIKSGSTLNQDFFTGLKKWLSLAGETAGKPYLVFGGDETGERNGVTFLSWRELNRISLID